MKAIDSFALGRDPAFQSSLTQLPPLVVAQHRPTIGHYFEKPIVVCLVLFRKLS